MRLNNEKISLVQRSLMTKTPGGRWIYLSEVTWKERLIEWTLVASVVSVMWWLVGWLVSKI